MEFVNKFVNVFLSRSARIEDDSLNHTVVVVGPKLGVLQFCLAFSRYPLSTAIFAAVLC